MTCMCSHELRRLITKYFGEYIAKQSIVKQSIANMETKHILTQSKPAIYILQTYQNKTSYNSNDQNEALHKLQP